TKWLKQEGEPVAADESLLEISTDKVDTEVPSPGEGVLQQILVQEGETAEVGPKLAVIAPEGAEQPEAPPAEAAPAPAQAPPAEAPAPAAPEPAPAPPPPPPPEPAPAAAPAQPPPPPAQPAPVAKAGQPQVGESFEPMTAMRRGIAEHMRRSLDTSAHVTSAIEVDMSKVVAIRGKLKKQFQDDYAVNPTYLAFVSRAVVETLREYPWVNGEIRGD